MARRVADWNADYLERVEEFPVLSGVSPGSVLAKLPDFPPEIGRELDELLQEFERVIVPALTHWAHPGFFGYFPAAGSAAGALGEMIAAVLNSNAMVWRSSPAGTELELVATGWLGRLLGLTEGIGVINDTASSSTMYALAAARARAYPEAEEAGLFGARPGRVYASEEAHSSVEKAARVAGLGKPVRIATRSDLGMSTDALHHAMDRDLACGTKPLAVVATLGTTSTAAMDPIGEIAEIAEEHGAWLHVDAAYGGVAAMLPELHSYFRGWERADSVVVNPHKWLFTPMDCSVLFCRRPVELARAFSIRPEYLNAPEPERRGGVRERAAADGPADLMDYGLSLGRRFRALKLWLVLNSFGRAGLVAALRSHIAMCRRLEDWIDAEADWERVASSPLATTAFRWRGGDRDNLRILAHVNGSGRAFVIHTLVGGRVALRAAVGNVRTRPEHVEELWRLLKEGAELVSHHQNSCEALHGAEAKP